ncbi:MAG: hypothetical protein J3Q66DRAFT_412773 [Benniella sp.]|nr:MAG: hypothetical protein J3Q66DRAFT_412773 [Benniella sp.]
MTNHNHNPLDLPEVRSIVGQHLDLPDLARCLRVSKSWHASFVPLVWSTTIWVGGHGAGHNNPSLEAFLRHSHYIKDLDLNIDASQQYSPTPCPNLLHLEVCIFRIYGSESMDIMPVVTAQYEQLRRLSIRNACMESLRVIWNPSHHRNLSELDLRLVEIEPAGTTAFWVLCTQLASLRIVRVSVAGMPARSITFDRLQHLDLELISRNPIEYQLDWITRCPNLTSLDWRYSSNGQPTSQFMRHFVPGTWPHLSELTLAGIEFTDAQLAQVIGAMQDLKSLSVRSCEVGPRFLETLRHHSYTLIYVSLDTLSCKVITRSLVPGILASFPHLETLYAHPVMSENIIDSPPWVCENSLKVLHICFLETPNQDAEYHQQVFQRISRLTNLKELRLVHGPLSARTLEFTLENGLEHLATWEHFKLFTFSHTARFSVRDVEDQAKASTTSSLYDPAASSTTTAGSTATRRVSGFGTGRAVSFAEPSKAARERAEELLAEDDMEVQKFTGFKSGRGILVATSKAAPERMDDFFAENDMDDPRIPKTPGHVKTVPSIQPAQSKGFGFLSGKGNALHHLLLFWSAHRPNFVTFQELSLAEKVNIPSLTRGRSQEFLSAGRPKHQKGVYVERQACSGKSTQHCINGVITQVPAGGSGWDFAGKKPSITPPDSVFYWSLQNRVKIVEDNRKPADQTLPISLEARAKILMASARYKALDFELGERVVVTLQNYTHITVISSGSADLRGVLGWESYALSPLRKLIDMADGSGLQRKTQATPRHWRGSDEKRLSRTRATKVGETRLQSHGKHVSSTIALQGMQPSGLVKYAKDVAKTEISKADFRLVEADVV